ncbi:phage/plasmid replication protein, II/X family [Thiocapsa rosea]|uniref:II/X family phage/plasmid replication protein n=1 Tax=Thiocapsa rosea TaxID=69360 RepID=A0A495VE31_9GAMM|nr:phage/plasmid replication protein, II/X family [Thiocapsa rosea]RKT46627.1 II/X family phage/plasmid replication protein [Thiocapsa rosea]
MLVDWITARLPLDLLCEEDRETLLGLGDRIRRFNPKTGELCWETTAWDSIRSDSHQINFKPGGDALWIQGSPGRVFGDGDAVFGAGPASALDLSGCVRGMAAMVFDAQGLQSSPSVGQWIVSRVDVTGMLLLDSLPDVRAALSVLKNCEGQRYRVEQQAGDTVYWSKSSRIRKGKAYAKGPHLRYLMKKRDYQGRRYTDDEIEAAGCLLRLELTLGAQWWRERAGKSWWLVSASELKKEWTEYFNRMLGDAKVTEMNLQERIRAVVETDGQAKAAHACWALIKAYGWDKARDMQSKSAWYRNLKALRDAGLSDADLSHGNVVPFRRPLIESRMVDSWADLYRLRAA